ncbi:MAG: T9SS type B sorting domain-containing protein [Flavobacterium sp.]|nr:T9SS type B sorting domain-containing protein [Flavobacterium sp.]
MGVVKNRVLFIFFGLVFQLGNAQYISVDENFTAQQLVQDKLINSPCANVFNVVVNGGNFASGEKSYGYFEATGTGFPFTNGIVLTTGKTINTIGPNASLSDDGGNMGWNGDSDLNQALGLTNTFNATVLEFDFIPQGDHISFDYIFSSEQYLLNPSANQCNYTDGFAFLLKRNGDTNYQNLAVVPNTNIPVKVNTVRGLGTLCPPANAAYFDAFNDINHPTNFNGQTKVLTAQSDVIPGDTYHIKLVIADEGNYRYDSALFLGGESFNFGIDLGEDRLISTGTALCPTQTLPLNATQSSAIGYQWFKNNIPLAGETNPIYLVTSAGDYSVTINYGGNCETTGTITVEYAVDLIVNQTRFSECDNDANQDGITAFNLTNIIPDLFTNLPSNYTISFFELTTSTTALPSIYTNTTPFEQTIYARITNIQGCYSDYPLDLIVNTFPTIVNDEEVGLCENTSITLDPGSGFTTYTWNTNPVQNTQTITVAIPGTYSVLLTNASNCSKTKTFTVTPSGIATINDIIINDFSENNTITVDYTGISTYVFSLDGTNYQSAPTFTNLIEGIYTVYVKDTKDCGVVPATFYILDYPKFFTPNGDGINDFWTIKNLNQRNLQNGTIEIFDRYGKLIHQINTRNQVWDGTFNGINLPSSDYWFQMKLADGKIIKGHFSLKR